MKYMTLEGSSGFKKLSLLPFNRQIKPRGDLKKSMDKYGFIGSIEVVYTNLVDGKWRYYIVDGQHRAATASYLEIKFKAEVIDGSIFKTLEELIAYVSTKNSTSKGWTAYDYVHAFAHCNSKSSYKYLLRRHNETGFSLPVLASIFGATIKSEDKGGSSATKEYIKLGKFEVKFKERGEQLLSFVEELNSIYEINSKMLAALNSVNNTKSISNIKFKNNYINNLMKIKECKNYFDLFKSWL